MRDVRAARDEDDADAYAYITRHKRGIGETSRYHGAAVFQRKIRRQTPISIFYASTPAESVIVYVSSVMLRIARGATMCTVRVRAVAQNTYKRHALPNRARMSNRGVSARAFWS